MQKLSFISCLLLLCLLAGWRAQAQAIYYNGCSSVISQNTLDTVSTNGANRSTLFTATGPDQNRVFRCTALAVDDLNGKLFLLDGTAGALWSLNLNGSGLTRVISGLTNFPTDLALDVLNQEIYYTTSSTIQDNNTVQRVNYAGNNNTTLFTATGGPEDDAVSRCTAIAVDVANSKIFVADAGARKIWSMDLAGGGVVPLVTATNSFPTDLALDEANHQVYFTLSSTVQNSNRIQRMNYDGSGLITLFAASGGVQRCTALDLDLAHDGIYLSDAGANTLWRIPTSGGSATPVLSGLTATAKKVRWFSGAEASSASFSPDIVSLSFSRTNVTLNATNGLAGKTYYVLTSTNLTLPLSQWSLVSTSILGAGGPFTITATNAFTHNTPFQFYTLRLQ
jgi:hypothetical protein